MKLVIILFKLLGTLVFIAISTFVIGFILNVAAIGYEPLASYIYCPDGSHMVTSWYQASWDQPGEKTLSGQCVGVNGKVVEKLPKDETTAREYRIFMPMGFAITIVLLIAWQMIKLIFKLVIRRNRNRQSSATTVLGGH